MWTNPESCSLLLHQLVISEHIATAASYHLILLHSLSLSSPPPPSLPPSTPSPSPPLHLLLNAWRCPARPVYAGSIIPLRPLQSEGEGCGTGWIVIGLCSQGGYME